MDKQIDQLETQVDEIELLIKKVDQDPDNESKMEKLKDKIEQLTKSVNSMDEAAKNVDNENKENITKETINENKADLDKIKKDISKLTKKLKEIEKDSSIAERKNYGKFGKTLETCIAKVNDAALTYRETAIRMLTQNEKETADQLDSKQIDKDLKELTKGSDVTGWFKKILSSNDLKIAGKCLGGYVKCIVGEVKEAGKLGSAIASILGKIGGNVGSSGFKRWTAKLMRGKVGVPTYLYQMYDSRDKAKKTKEHELLGGTSQLYDGLKHIWHVYQKSCLTEFAKNVPEVPGTNLEKIEVDKMSQSLKFWTTNYNNQDIQILAQDYKTWKTNIKKNVKKDLTTMGEATTNNAVNAVARGIMNIKDKMDALFTNGVSIAVQPKNLK